MKLLIVLAGIFLFHKPAPTLLIIDRELKKPWQPATEFTTQQYMQNGFPIYASDLDALEKAANKAAIQIGQGMICYSTDTVKTSRSGFLLHIDCHPMKTITVILQTFIPEKDITYNFSLVTKEASQRKAQQKLLDFATYLKP